MAVEILADFFLSNRRYSESLRFCISFDKNSLKDDNGNKSAWFHIYISDKCNLYKVENKQINSAIIQYSASCNEKNLLKPLEVKYYDDFNKTINEVINYIERDKNDRS